MRKPEPPKNSRFTDATKDALALVKVGRQLNYIRRGERSIGPSGRGWESPRSRVFDECLRMENDDEQHVRIPLT